MVPRLAPFPLGLSPLPLNFSFPLTEGKDELTHFHSLESLLQEAHGPSKVSGLRRTFMSTKWSGAPSGHTPLLQLKSCPTLWPHDCSLLGSSVHADSPGKNTGVGCHALLQGIFPTQGSNPGRLHCRQILYHLSYQGGTREALVRVSGAVQIKQKQIISGSTALECYFH